MIDLVARWAAWGDVHGVRATVDQGMAPLVAFARFGRSGIIDPDLLEETLAAGFSHMRALILLDRVAAATTIPLVVFKGLEVAARYPSPGLRAFSDVDVLTTDPQGVFDDLCAAGFQQPGVDAAPGHHHLPALALPGFEGFVEVHSAVGRWPWLRIPPTAELMGRAVPSLAHDRFLALHPDDHLISVAAHAWDGRGLGFARDLEDYLVLEAATTEQLAVRAREWGALRLLRMVDAAANRSPAAAARRKRSPSVTGRADSPSTPGWLRRRAALFGVAGPRSIARTVVHDLVRLERSTRDDMAAVSGLRRGVQRIRLRWPDRR